MRTNRQVIDLALQLAATTGLALWCFLVIQPFVPIIAWGTILAIGLHPIFRWLARMLGHRSTLAASLLGIGGVGLIVGPVALISINLLDDLRRLAALVNSGSFSLPPIPGWIGGIPVIGDRVVNLWVSAGSDLLTFLQRFEPQLESIGKLFLGLGANAGLAVLQLIVAMVVATMFILNAEPLGKRIGLVVRRLAPAKSDQLIALATSTLKHVIRGVIGVAVVQSGLIGIALVLAGIPWAGILALICFVLCLLQVGPTLVILPVLIYIWFTMSKLAALLLTLWLIPAGLIDNVLKPIWMARGLPVPLVVVLLGVIGGTLTNGLLGLFAGPVVLSLGYAILRLWAQDGELLEGEQ